QTRDRLFVFRKVGEHDLGVESPRLLERTEMLQLAPVLRRVPLHHPATTVSERTETPYSPSAMRIHLSSAGSAPGMATTRGGGANRSGAGASSSPRKPAAAAGSTASHSTSASASSSAFGNRSVTGASEAGSSVGTCASIASA